MNFKNTTFVITTFKSEKIIYKCLKSLPKNVKKIIIENSQNYFLKKDLEKKFHNLKCYVMKENLGYGKSNNFGIKKVKTKYAFILNPDVEFGKKNFSFTSKILSKIDFSLAAPLERSDFKNYNFKDNFIEVDSVKGFAMILNLKKLKNIFFDRNIFLYLEEIDLCKRIKDKNGKIILINLVIKHLGGKSHGINNDFEMEKSRNWHWMWSRFYYLKKHNGYFFAFIKMLPSLVISILKIIYYFSFFNYNKKTIYLMRFKGLINSYMLKKSSYRPYRNI